MYGTWVAGCIVFKHIKTDMAYLSHISFLRIVLYCFTESNNTVKGVFALTQLKNDWKDVLSAEFQKEYCHSLKNTVENEYLTQTVFPQKELIFNALNFTAFCDVKVVILGQDPYHGEGQAHGLAFSVNRGVKIPPSLRNIYKELSSDLGIDVPTHGDLSYWAQQGVLLLNTVLTVRKDHANSHQGIGWETFTDSVIAALGNRPEPLVFMLWGKPAQKKLPLIKSHHLVLQAAHPSPLSASRGFLGCKHFSAANEFLQQKGIAPIDWRIT